MSSALTHDEAVRVISEHLDATGSVTEGEADALDDEFVDMILKATLLDLWRDGLIKCAWIDGEMYWRQA